jgi:hypothetical protein
MKKNQTGPRSNSARACPALIHIDGLRLKKNLNSARRYLRAQLVMKKLRKKTKDLAIYPTMGSEGSELYNDQN